MFETYLVQKRPHARRAGLIVVSVAVHVLGGLLIGLYSILHVQEITPPELTVTFFAAPPPPPPPPPASTAQTKSTPHKTRPKVVRTSALTEPVPKAVKPEPEPEEAEAAPDTPAETGGVAGGVVGGVAGGVVGGVVDSKAVPAPAKPKMVPSFVFDRERISAPDPHLPGDFLNTHAKQTLTGSYRICVGPDGRVTEVIPIRGILGADDVIIQTVKETWRWKPQPLPVCTIRNFVFKIS